MQDAFHLFKSFLISFSNFFFQLSVYKSFTSLVKFILDHFILLDTNVN